MSESKFRDDPAAFVPHIRARDRAALAALITKPDVERRLLQRLRKKAALYALSFSPDGEPLPDGDGADGAPRKLDVDGVVELYEHYIIPLTKEVEVRLRPRLRARCRPRMLTGRRAQVDYLLVRLDGLSDEEVEKLVSKEKHQ